MDLALQLLLQHRVLTDSREKRLLRLAHDVLAMGLSGHQLGCVEAFIEGDTLLFSECVLDDPRGISRHILWLLWLLVALELGFEVYPLGGLGLPFIALV